MKAFSEGSRSGRREEKPSCPAPGSNQPLPLLIWLVLFAAAPIFGQSAPYAHTQPATDIRPTSATLNGMAVANGSASIAWFEWGERGSYGQFTEPVAVGDGVVVVQVSATISNLAAGGAYQCRLVVSSAAGVTYGATQWFTTGRHVTAWGNNSAGQISVPAGLTNVVAVTCGEYHSLGLRADGTVVAWGGNWAGQTNVPAAVTDVVAVAAGRVHSLALKADGTVAGWGSNYYYHANVPTGLSNIVAVACGEHHSLALRTDGTVVAWGAGEAGETGDGRCPNYGQSIVPEGLSNVVAVAGGEGYSLALRADGTVVMWGSYDSCQASPPPVTTLPEGLTNLVSLAGGTWHSLALRADTTVLAWGHKWYWGWSPAVPAGLSNVVAVAAAGFQNFAVRTDGSLLAWEYTGGPSSVPVGLTNVVAVDAGESHVVALSDNLPPQALAQEVSSPDPIDVVIGLKGSDLNGDPLSFRITSLPAAGALFQYDSTMRGAAILTAETVVSDAAGRVIFAPDTDGFGSPYASFSFVASDDLADSAPATVTINIVLPPAPQLTNLGWTTNREFELHFTGHSNAVYRVWASTDLVNWQPLGPATMTAPGVFEFIDTSSTRWPRRFYRPGAP